MQSILGKKGDTNKIHQNILGFNWYLLSVLKRGAQTCHPINITPAFRRHCLETPSPYLYQCSAQTHRQSPPTSRGLLGTLLYSSFLSRRAKEIAKGDSAPKPARIGVGASRLNWRVPTKEEECAVTTNTNERQVPVIYSTTGYGIFPLK